MNRQIGIDDPLNNTTTYRYNEANNLTATIDALGRITTYQYDDRNRLVTVTNPLGDTVTTTYDNLGNVIAVTDELGRKTEYLYDKRNLQTAVIDSLENTTTTSYDSVGNVVSVTDSLGNTIRYSYDNIYRQTAITDPEGGTTKFTYDGVSNLLTLTDPENNTTTYTYDSLYRLLTETNQLGATRSYKYDAVGNQTEITDRNGRIRQFTYDSLNRNTQEIWVGKNGRTITYSYDAASQLTAVRDPDSSYRYNYDLAGRLIEVDNEGIANIPRVVLSYSYDKVGNILQVTDSLGGSESFTYDDLNRAVQITQTGTGVVDKRVDLSYNAASQMTGIVRYGDLAGNELVAQSNYEYDGVGRLIDLTHSRNSVILANYAWIYDNAHRVTRFTSPDGISNYTYDNRGQLLEGDHDYQSDESYSYDDNGNITNAGYVTGANNRLLSNSMYNYAYDAEGNRIQRTAIATGEVTSYEWDFRNRLIKGLTLDSDGNIVNTVAYAYDVFDRRISKSLNGAISEVFVYDGDHIALVFDGDGELTQRNFHGPLIDQILAVEGAGSQVQWGLGDNLGTIRLVVNAAGEVQNRIVYDSFGEVIEESNPEVNFRYGFTGRELDPETGLVYYRARYFDGGRFISEDPIGFGGGDGNLYRYVFNSPTNFTDPSGEEVITIAVGTGVITVLVVGGIIVGVVVTGVIAGRLLSDAIGGIRDLLDRRRRDSITFPDTPPPLTTPPFPAPTPPRREQTPGDFGPTPGLDVPNTAPFPFPVPDEGVGPNVIPFPRTSCPAIPPFLESNSGGPSGTPKPFDHLSKGPINPTDLDLEALTGAANEPLGKGGLTKAGRALDKHAAGQRGQSPFPPLRGNNANKNKIAEQQVDKILHDSSASFKKLGRGGVEAKLPDGRGVRFNQDGSFSGFVD